MEDIGDSPAPIPGWNVDGYGPGLVQSSAVIPQAKDGVGAFRLMDCDVTHYSDNDPIVFPKQPGAAHRHMFFGNKSTNAWTTTASLEAASTSCSGGIRNLSAYWVPAMLDGKGVTKEPFDVWVYYKGGYAVDGSLIQVPPRGLRMVAGPNLTIAPWAKGARWQGCGDGATFHNTCKAGQTLELRFMFPQCWDGTRLDSPDHKSHMAHPNNGKCPATHPVPIPEVTLVIFWKYDTAPGWHLSSDTADHYPGQSAHADWWMAWKPEVAEAFVKGCIRAKKSCNNGELGNGWRMVQP